MSVDSDYPPEWPQVSLQVKVDQGFRCVRCQHPNARWSCCGNHEKMAEVMGERMGFSSPVRIYPVDIGGHGGAWLRHHEMPCDDRCTHDPEVTEWRIITVHHLDDVKENLAWWNLACLCQRCHLTIQGKVRMAQAYMHPHSEWFLPYVAGFYAQVLEDQPTREEVISDLPRFLALGQPHLEDHYRSMMEA